MSKVVLIIAGVLILLLLLFLIVARTPNIRQRISGMRRPVVLAVVGILLAALVFISLNLFLPRGENSLFSQTAEEETGETEETQQETEESAAGKGSGFSLEKALDGNASGDEAVYVTVKGNTSYIGENAFSDLADLRDALFNLQQQTGQFVLVDDYAFSGQYQKTRELLEELGIGYEEIQK